MLALVQPKQPYVHWVRQHSDMLGYMLTESLREDSISFLIPVDVEHNDHEEVQAYVADCWAYFFEEMLCIWKIDDTTWSQDRTRVMFHHWFNVEVCNMVLDLGQ